MNVRLGLALQKLFYRYRLTVTSVSTNQRTGPFLSSRRSFSHSIKNVMLKMLAPSFSCILVEIYPHYIQVTSEFCNMSLG